VTVSCGISCKEGPGQSIIDVIHAADKALYKAKESGRNQVKMGKTTVSASKEKISARFFIQFVLPLPQRLFLVDYIFRV